MHSLARSTAQTLPQATMKCLTLCGGRIRLSVQLERSGFCLSEPFSTTSCASIKYRKWTADEDRKIQDLQGLELSAPKIAAQLEDRSSTHVRYRLKRLREEKERVKSSRTPWSNSEEQTMMRKRLEGLTFRQIESFLPGRNWQSIAVRFRGLRNEVPHEEQKATPWTKLEKQDIIDMKVNGKLSTFKIARSLKRSFRSVQYVWRSELKPQLSKETIDNLRPSNGWTAEQDQLLRDLRQKGLRYNQMVIPGKTLRSIYDRSKLLQIPSSLRARPSPAEAISTRRALERVLAGEITLKEVQEQFPGATGRRFINMLSRLRTGHYKKKD